MQKNLITKIMIKQLLLALLELLGEGRISKTGQRTVGHRKIIPDLVKFVFKISLTIMIVI